MLVVSSDNSFVKGHCQLTHLVFQLHVLLSKVLHLFEVLIVVLRFVDDRAASESDWASVFRV